MQIGLKNNIALKFAIKFIGLFGLFYYGNIIFFGLTLPGNHYSAFLRYHLNYIGWLRWALLHSAASCLTALGYIAKVSDTELLVVGHGIVQLIYTCLGLGVMSFFAAFVIAYPKQLKPKLLFLIAGLMGIQFLNIIRIALLALYWNRSKARIIDHHLIFDVLIYIIIIVVLYRWVNNRATNVHATN